MMAACGTGVGVNERDDFEKAGEKNARTFALKRNGRSAWLLRLCAREITGAACELSFPARGLPQSGSKGLSQSPGLHKKPGNTPSECAQMSTVCNFT